ncbi:MULTISPECIES: hypothetical protein [unclassified Polaromonas]|jgi:hypothetical protein|uniref:hypothetical protein n=1 Tax=unclassified Polaromonas TaxID=2638319 RepID=UPI0018C8F97B|nr:MULTISPECIES: hypothetical protein [unclassified Polaromonas]MBG6072377.1 hypothetical protein [Polaromonas sp. CG_9.7]MBG6114192.1 hypothetical protein [Polaromonas sp. CG_9.2]MDH6182850.1 hypothetical protein [Polaromonas sp. CG_23.6]
MAEWLIPISSSKAANLLVHLVFKNFASLSDVVILKVYCYFTNAATNNINKTVLDGIVGIGQSV